MDNSVLLLLEIFDFFGLAEDSMNVDLLALHGKWSQIESLCLIIVNIVVIPLFNRRRELLVEILPKTDQIVANSEFVEDLVQNTGLIDEKHQSLIQTNDQIVFATLLDFKVLERRLERI